MTQNLPAILVVDDDDDIRAMVSDLLEMHGYQVQTATDGAEALQCLRANRDVFGLVLLDLMMRGMDGWQFLVEQRRDPTIADIPVIVLSAGAPRHTLLASIPFVKKPFDIQHLLDLVARTVRRATGARDAERQRGRQGT